MDAKSVINALNLKPHPEGGWYRETWRAATTGERAAGTSIYYLLSFGERSHWHRIDSAEIWHYYAGSPLRLSMSPEGEKIAHHMLGTNIEAGERPQLIVPENAWQAAESLGPYTLLGCTVSPGFEFDQFEIAPAGWVPGARR